MIGYIILAAALTFFSYRVVKVVILDPRKFMANEADGNYNALRRTYKNAGIK